MSGRGEASGLAALSVCEALVFALIGKGILDAEEARGALEDAAAAHRGADPEGLEPERHAEAVRAIERIIGQLNAVR